MYIGRHTLPLFRSPSVRRSVWGLAAGAAVVLGACANLHQMDRNGGAATVEGPATPQDTVTLEGEIGLHSLISLADGHLLKLADVYAILATMDAVRSADWEQVREPLSNAAQVNIPAVYWFALPDGSYWTLAEGRAEANLADRAYFPRVLAGQTIIGDLVISRATGRSTAIVAHPVYGDEDEIVGVLGASVYLDRLSGIINEEMNLGPNHVFFSLDQTPIVGLHKDPETIFLHPLEEDDPQLTSAIREILRREHGVISYHYRGERRTIHYARSPVTGWWYGFGQVHR